MSMSATAYDTVVVLEIFGPNASQDLGLLKRLIPEEDRVFDRQSGRFTIKHPEKYQEHFPSIKRALANNRQLKLF